MELEDILAPARDPIFFTMINPAPEKGLVVVARLAEELGLRYPDIPLLIVESRARPASWSRPACAPASTSAAIRI